MSGRIFATRVLRLALLAALLGPARAAYPEATAGVAVSDRGIQTHVNGPGAPPHVIGLTHMNHTLSLDTGPMTYALCYTVSLDPKDPKAAIPGEGYIGMSAPSGFNWYQGGFFDLILNGRSIGTTMAHTVAGRASQDRGYVDFVFDAPQAVVRVRFVARTGGDCLFCQARVEPKEEIRTARLNLRCYPSGFISSGDRHILSATRDLPQNQSAILDTEKEWWLLCYDRIYESGVEANGLRGGGPCAVLWCPDQVAKGTFRPGGYSADISLDLKPEKGDYRFLFFDFAGKSNATSQAALRARASALGAELAAFDFTDPALKGWPVERKWAEVQKALDAAADPQARARYEKWHQDLPGLLKAAAGSGAGGILAEAAAVKVVGDWDQGLPELLLQELLNGI